MILLSQTAMSRAALHRTFTWEELGKEYENSHAKRILDFTLTQLIERGDVIFLTAFGAEGCVLMHFIYELLQNEALPKRRVIKNIEELSSPLKPGQPGRLAIVNLDTGYQFADTLELKEELEEAYNLPIIMLRPEQTVEEQDAQYGTELFKRDPDHCCYLRKLRPLHKLLSKDRLAWITSIRRDQTENRSSAQAFELDPKYNIGKINPLIKWSKSDIWKTIHENKIPYNPLLDEGYESVGCEPCTSTGNARASGRWSGKEKIECGIHLASFETGGEFSI